MKVNRKGGSVLTGILLISFIFFVIIVTVAVTKHVEKQNAENDEEPAITNIIETSQTTTSQTSEVESVTKSEYSITINKTFISQDYAKSPCLVIEYEWTNNSDKETSFTFAFNDTLYQDGIECSGIVVGCPDEDAEQQLLKIQPGITMTLNVAYKLSNTESSPQIIVKDLFGRETFINATIQF